VAEIDFQLKGLFPTQKYKTYELAIDRMKFGSKYGDYSRHETAKGYTCGMTWTPIAADYRTNIFL
jgi:hypothetical protein